MSFIKDYHDQHLTLLKRYWWKELINPRNIYYTAKHRYQRAERGYSDRDIWNGGDHILDVATGVLKGLAQEKNYLKWDEYFKSNYKSKVYEDFEGVIKDLDDYIAFDDLNWADTLGFDLKHDFVEREDGNTEMVSANTPKEERLIKKAIRDSHKEWKRRYAKMKQAMYFVADNIPGLWD